jgi:hypothetical protein
LGLNVEEEILIRNSILFQFTIQEERSQREKNLENGTWEKMNIRSAAVIERKI